MASRNPGGYTLLEIVLVVAIIAMIIGVAVPMTSGFMREQRLRDVVRELLVLAKTARADAMTTGRASAVIFGKKEFGLQRPGDEEPSEVVSLPAGMSYVLLPFGAEKAVRPDGQRWVFQQAGLCEPLAVRIEEGDAWMEVSFDPLTASIDDESYHIP